MAKEGAAWAKPDADERVAELVRCGGHEVGADEGVMNRTPLYRPPSGSIPTLGVPSLEGVTKVHLIGVGGAGMRNLARLSWRGASRSRART